MSRWRDMELRRLVRWRRAEEGIRALESYLISHSDDTAAAIALGRLYLRQGDPDSAARWLQHALAQDGEQSVSPDSDPDEWPDDVIGESDLAYIESEMSDGQHGQFEQGMARLLEPSRSSTLEIEDPIDDRLIQFDDNPIRGRDTGSAASWNESAHREGIVKPSVLDNWEKQGARTRNEEELRELLSAFDETPSVEIYEDSVSDDRLTVEERALQYAAIVATRAGWSEEELPSLVEVFTHHRSHYKTRQVVSELIFEWQMTAAELDVLFSLRSQWSAGGFNRAYLADVTIDMLGDLSWRLGLKLIRGLRFESAEEAMLFLDDCFEDWCQSPRLLGAFLSFRSYLNYVLDHMEAMSNRWNDEVPAFIDYAYFPREDLELEIGSPGWKELEEYGLLAHQSDEIDWAVR